MVECFLQLDMLFGSLADPTRRDILRRVAREDLSISELAEPYQMSFAAIAKHVNVLESAGLVMKRREGKQQIVCMEFGAMKQAESHLKGYEKMRNTRSDALDIFLQEKIRV